MKLACATLFALAAAHSGDLPINPALGVPGFPNCVHPTSPVGKTVEQNAMEIVCSQKSRSASSIKIGTIGDSITAGVHSSGGNHTYPGQLQILLDQADPGKYDVTNLGACGSTMLKISNSPYWKRPQYSTLTKGKWDIIIIMLGTNDAKDPGDHGPNNWLHNCGGPDATTLSNCSFASDFHDMITVVKTLGTTPAGPKIFTAVPPPLMAQFSIGANQTVINSVYPKLVPLINKAGDIGTTSIDVFSGMGGVADWSTVFPKSCTLDTAKTYKPCAWWCDKQSCDQCHPNNDGYTQMAKLMKAGLGL